MKADRRLGIPGTNHGEWGDHLCVFYQGKEDLLSLVVPYIRAGLEDNEFCMWITGRPINEYEAFQALEAVVPEAHRYLADRQLEILPHSQWYLSSGVFDAQVILDNWTSKARHAQSKGFAGIRITGNPFWLQSEQEWGEFGCYERRVQESLRGEPVIALCTYPRDICGGANILRTLAAHGSALVPHGHMWQRLAMSPR